MVQWYSTVHHPWSTLVCGCVQGPQPCSTRSSAVFYKVLSRVLQGPQSCSTRSSVVFYKVLSRVLQGYADLFDPLDQKVADRASIERVFLFSEHKKAQLALSTCKYITIPQPSDVLWIVACGSVKNIGIAATLYVRRSNKLLLAGFFNAKLRMRPITWLPCEVEALSIGAAIKRFAPFIIQSSYVT